MHIVLVGLNHRSAPIELRERLAFRREQLPDAFARLRQEIGLQEAAILSTCNRVEIYAGVPEVNGAIPRLHRFLSEHGRMDLEGLSTRLYSYTEPHSVKHLFSVASGLDSMIMGEGEIACQVKHAYEWARAQGATGKVFNVLFQKALNAAKTVRSQTGIGQGCSSVGGVAVELAEKIFGHLSRATVLLVGAGKIGEITLKRLADRGVGEVRVMNRTADRAAHVASVHGALPVAFDSLAAQLVEADIIISSTGAPSFLVCSPQVLSAMRVRHQRPLCLIDLGVPRNLEPAIGQLENVYLFNIDDLQGLVHRSQAQRQRALAQSEAIIASKVDHFVSWWQCANAE